jgi:hypothetical protein
MRGIEEAVARALLAAGGPIGRPARQVQRVALPVPVRGRDEPDGVPLEAILAATRDIASTVQGAAVRGSELELVHSSEPTTEQRDALASLLGDEDRLRALGTAQPEPALAGETLRDVLLDAGTPDAEWLRAFRRWAVSELIQPGGSG